MKRLLKYGSVGLLAVLVFGAFASFNAEDSKYPKGYFTSPLKIPLYLSGTFGELRSNHFHAGIDIKTNQQQGLPVYAAADGFVSRIKVSPWGYGKALYVTHPNGFTTVYAHLRNFNEEIDEYIKAMQYQRRKFDIELFPLRSKFVIKQGEVVAHSGNSGGSSAAHLHFEIRESGTEKPVNPLLFGFPVKDTREPSIKSIFVYDFGKLKNVSDPMEFRTLRTGTHYTLTRDVAKVNSNKIGIGIKTFDKLNGANNENGPYALTIKVDSSVIYRFEAEKFAFSETRYLNAHIDFKHKFHKRSYINRCFLLPGNNFSGYSELVDNGIIDLSNGKKRLIEIEVMDAYGNASTCGFHIQKSETAGTFTAKGLSYMATLPWQKANDFKSDGIDIHFPEGCFYDTVYLHYNGIPSNHPKIYTLYHELHYDDQPVHNRFTISLLPKNFPEALKKKALMVRKNSKGGKTSVGGEWHANKFVARPRKYGTFYVTLDTVKPTIIPVNVFDGKDMSGSKYLRMRIRDDLAGVKSYSAKMNGNWILMEYDGKNEMLTYTFDEKTVAGNNSFELTLTDDRGNTTLYKANIKR